MSPLHVDAFRIGGTSTPNRHSFGVAKPAAAAPPKKPRFIDPPPKRDLGQGAPKAAAISPADLEKFQTSLKPIIEALQLELEAAKQEADMVSGPTLRVEPDLYKSIGIIGPYFTPQEVRSTILVDANELENVANRLSTGALGSYLSADQKMAVTTAATDAKKLKEYVQQFDLTPLSGASAKLAEDHVASHTTQLLDEIKEAEKNVVSVEAGNIPVVEPMEKGLGAGGLLAVGALVAIGIIIADLI
jgi:hypothetical protein